jgi:hypothetical protein
MRPGADRPLRWSGGRSGPRGWTKRGSHRRNLFWTGSDGERIYALAALEELPELATAETVRLAELIATRLTPAEKAVLNAALERQIEKQAHPPGQRPADGRDEDPQRLGGGQPETDLEATNRGRSRATRSA